MDGLSHRIEAGNHPELEPEAYHPCVDDDLALVVGDGIPLLGGGLPGHGLDLVQLGGQKAGVQLGRHILVSGPLDHLGQLGPKLVHSPADGVASGGGVQEQLLVLLLGPVVVVGHLVEAVETQELRLFAVHLGGHLDGNSLVGAGSAPGFAAVKVAVLDRKVYDPHIHSVAAYLHRSSPSLMIRGPSGHVCDQTRLIGLGSNYIPAG